MAYNREFGMTNEFHYEEDAEKAVLGAMMEDIKAVPACIHILGENPEVFLFIPHQIIYGTMVELFKEAKAIDPVLLCERIEKREELNRIGGAVYIYDLWKSVPTAENAEYYSDIVKTSYIRRQLDVGAKKILQLTKEEVSLTELLSLAQECVLKVGVDSIPKTITPAEQANDTYNQLVNWSKGKLVEISTGFPQLDALTYGLHRKQLTVLASPPSVGKSAFAHNILYHLAVENNVPCVLFCYESDHVAVHARMISMATGIDLRQHPELTTSEEVIRILKKIEKSPLIIEDICPRSVEYAVTATRRWQLEYPHLAVIICDHLQMMSSAQTGRYDNYEREMARISGSLKDLAKTANVAVMGISQLSRDSVKRARRPSLDDLRGSGALEQDGDLVMFLYREDYFETLYDSPISETELIVRKQKDGPIGTIKLQYERAISRFKEF